MPGFTERELPNLFQVMEMLDRLRQRERKRVQHIEHLPYAWLEAFEAGLEEHRTSRGEGEFYRLAGRISMALVRMVDGDEAADTLAMAFDAFMFQYASAVVDE